MAVQRKQGGGGDARVEDTCVLAEASAILAPVDHDARLPPHHPLAVAFKIRVVEEDARCKWVRGDAARNVGRKGGHCEHEDHERHLNGDGDLCALIKVLQVRGHVLVEMLLVKARAKAAHELVADYAEDEGDKHEHDEDDVHGPVEAGIGCEPEAKKFDELIAQCECSHSYPGQDVRAELHGSSQAR